MDIVLYQPQIPQNTGNIIRTCSVTNSGLILVKPLGFRINDRMLLRSGLDYHKEVPIMQIEDLEIFLQKTTRPFYFFSSQAEKPYTDISFAKDALLIFGSETHGLNPQFAKKYSDHFYTIPMKPTSRCLNLSNSVAIVLYEGLRQQNFTFSS
jgi:tRNA (cytidine/uridine-2'-O-)-methyltransferase